MAPSSPAKPVSKLNEEAMKYIWSQVQEKEIRDGVEYIVYIKDDLPIMYYSGLVDTRRFSLAEWEKAFEDCKGADQRYWVSYEKMISLGHYRYCKLIGEPFDPLRIEPGKYHVDQIWRVFERSVIPSTSLPEDFIKNTFNQIFRLGKKPKDVWSKDIEKAKQKGTEVKEEDVNQSTPEVEGDYIILKTEHLVNIKNLIDTYPSPRRRLELGVQALRTAELQHLSEAAHNLQKSTFQSGPDFRNTTKRELKDMLVKASDNPTAGRKPMDEVLDLKAMQKQRRPPVKF